jgi:tetratricopeptide (TPR) repeat protein
MVLKRVDINSTKEISIKGKGDYLQVGLDPKEYDLIVTAEGYVEYKERIKIPLGDALVKNITLKTIEEANAEMGQKAVTENPGAAKANEGVSAFNEAVQFYNGGDFVVALEKFEASIENFREALTTAKDDSTKADAEKNLITAEKMLAFCQFELGNAKPEQRNNLWLKAESVLKNNLEKTEGNERANLAERLLEIAKMKGDTAAEDKYNDIIEKISGPNPKIAYNKGVDLYNAGNLSQAKPHLKKAIEIDPKFEETYYLLAICEYNDGNLKDAKNYLQKYLELAPNGKSAAIVKEMLTDPSLKDIK